MGAAILNLWSKAWLPPAAVSSFIHFRQFQPSFGLNPYLRSLPNQFSRPRNLSGHFCTLLLNDLAITTRKKERKAVPKWPWSCQKHRGTGSVPIAPLTHRRKSKHHRQWSAGKLGTTSSPVPLPRLPVLLGCGLPRSVWRGQRLHCLRRSPNPRQSTSQQEAIGAVVTVDSKTQLAQPYHTA